MDARRDTRLRNESKQRVLITDELYFGNPVTDGTWRLRQSLENLLVEINDSGSWIEQGRFEQTVFAAVSTRITEDGTIRITEGGDTRVTEG